MTDPKPTRIRRPDQAVDADVAQADLADAEETVAAPAPAPFNAPSAPFTAEGVMVNDSQGRPVCLVANAHLTLERREELAAWIAGKLNG